MSTTATTSSKNANLVILYLGMVLEGEGVTRDEITAATGVDVSSAGGAGTLRTARMALEQQANITFKFISGYLTRMGDQDRVVEAARRSNQGFAKIEQARRLALSVNDYDSLSACDQEIHARVVTTASVAHHINKPSVINEIMAQIKARGGAGAVSGRDFLKMISTSSAPTP